MSVCASVAGAVALVAASGFTLSWTHSVERTEWRERWMLTDDGLRLVEARVRGSGAGMDPGAGARLEDGWWVWAPTLPAVPSLTLAASGKTGGGWTLCDGVDGVDGVDGEDGAGCRELGATSQAPTLVAPCPRNDPRMGDDRATRARRRSSARRSTPRSRGVRRADSADREASTAYRLGSRRRTRTDQRANAIYTRGTERTSATDRTATRRGRRLRSRGLAEGSAGDTTPDAVARNDDRRAESARCAASTTPISIGEATSCAPAAARCWTRSASRLPRRIAAYA